MRRSAVFAVLTLLFVVCQTTARVTVPPEDYKILPPSTGEQVPLSEITEIAHRNAKAALSLAEKTQQDTGAGIQTEDLKQTAEALLEHMTQLIQEVKQQQRLQTQQVETKAAQKTKHDTDMLISVLEEQFHAMETWLMPMTHGQKKDRDKVIGELTGRFEAMVQGYTKLIEVLRAKKTKDARQKAGGRRQRPGPRKSEGSPRKAEVRRPKTEGQKNEET